jgi:hypothetical protein
MSTRFYARRLLGFVGEAMVWVGFSNFLYSHFVAPSVGREVFYYVFGYLIMTLSSDFFWCFIVGSGAVDEAVKARKSATGSKSGTANDSDGQDAIRAPLPAESSTLTYNCVSRSSLLHLRAVISTLSFLTMWCAVNNVLEDYVTIFPTARFLREALYVKIGLALMLATDTFFGQTTPFSWRRPSASPYRPFDYIDSESL